MAGLVKSGASYAQSWALQRTLETADQGTGQTVLTEQYADLKDAPLAAASRAIERGNYAQAASAVKSGVSSNFRLALS